MWPLGAARKWLKLIPGNCLRLQSCDFQLNNGFFMKTICCFNSRQRKAVLDIPIPAKQVTSAAFGGPNLDILYVTTAATNRDGAQPPQAGMLFKVTGLGVKGLPGVNVRV